MEFEAQELFWLHRVFGQARSGATVADAEHRFQVRKLLEFTDDEKVAVAYREVPNPNGTWGFQFQQNVALSRELTERQTQKVIAVWEEVLPTLTGDTYALLRGVVLRLGWLPPQEETNSGAI